MNIAIFGAAGSIGPVAAKELLARGHRVRAVGRDEERLRAALPGAEPFVADLADPQQARRAAAGMDAVLFSVGLPYQDFDRYPGLTATAVEAAAVAGVQQFLAVSTVYVYGRARAERVTEDHPREPHTRKGAARKRQADIISAADGRAGMRTALLVLPDFYGPNLQNTYLTAVFDGAASGKSASVIGPLDRPHEFVYVPDVGPVVAGLFDRPAAFDGTAYHLGGAGTIVPRELYEAEYRAAGRSPKLLVAQLPVIRLMGLFSPLMREMVEMHYLWTDPVVLDDAKLERTLGGLRKTPYAAGVLAGLAAAQAALGAKAGV